MNIDTHAFVKAFVNAKTDEQKAEIIADIVFKVKDLSEVKIETRFEKAKEELATKSDIIAVKRDIKDLELTTKKEIAESKNDLMKWMFGMFLAFSSAQLTLFVLILKFFFKGVGAV